MAMIRTYTETYDMNTETDCPTILAVHTPIGPTPYRMLDPCFRMYRKYKYLGADVTVVNAARLPVDPSQIGQTAGQNYVDPRDVLNPILFKGCHGESLGSILDSMYNGLLSAANEFHDSALDKDIFSSYLANFYYTALGDDSWRKSPVSKTLSIKNLHPLVYSLSTNHQILPTNSLDADNYRDNNPATPSSPSGLGNTSGSSSGQFGQSSAAAGWVSPIIGPTHVFEPSDQTWSYKVGLNSMFTSKMHRLGWLDTMQYIGQNVDPAVASVGNQESIALLPKVFMGVLMLPPANLVRQYLRVIIRHKFKFAGYRSITEGSSQTWNYTDTRLGYYEHYTGNVETNSKELTDADLDAEMVVDENAD